MEICFSLGSNLGDRLQYLKQGRNGLADRLHAQRVEQSAVYETVPMDVLPRDREKLFLNAVVIVDVDEDCRAALQIAHSIEQDLGRARGRVNAPRTLDVDIIYADALRMEKVDLKVPHPRWKQREFVVRPLAELRPGLVLPGEQDCVAKILENFGLNGNVVPFAEEW